MHAKTFLTLVSSVTAVVGAPFQGFNYGSTHSDNSPVTQDEFQSQFTTAQNLVGTSGFTSARLFTMIQAGTVNAPTTAIPAAIATKTTLLLGLWASVDQGGFNNELAALAAAISQYGQPFADLIAGISVGSEDLYRNSPIGISNKSGVGADPDVIVNYIKEVRNVIANTVASSKPVGHVDTWTAWVNGSNAAVVEASDFIGHDAYPYFQNTQSNSIDSGAQLFNEALQATTGAAQGKPVWVTETGWPVTGPDSNLAVPSIGNAETYWKEVGCSLFGKTNTWWFTLQDTPQPSTSPSFGIVGQSLSTTPLYDLSCGASTGSSTTVVNTPTPVSTPTSVASGFQTSVVPSPPAQSPTPSPPTVPSSSGCGTTLTGDWQYPHLIIPIDKTKPDTAAGTSYDGVFSSTVSSLFNFDIPASYAGRTCSLIFDFPQKDQLTTSSYTLSGSGGVAVSKLASPATQSTTYNNAPGGTANGGIASLTSGNSYVIATGACAAGQVQSFRLDATGTLSLDYFQNYGQPPIGLYITAC